MLIIKNGIIHDAVNPEPFKADILVESGKIVRIAEDISAPDATVYDAEGKDIYPGFIDVHSHIGMFGYCTMTKEDVEKNDYFTPNNKGLDAIDILEPGFQVAAKAGVTTVCVGPGSVGCITGTAVALKTYGTHIDEMVVKDPVAMKAAMGENTKLRMPNKVTTRMTITSVIRDSLIQAKEYKDKKDRATETLSAMPSYNPKLEALIPVIEKKIPLKVHAYQTNDLFAILRIAKECDVDITLEHAADAYMLADELIKEDIPVAMGPFWGQATKYEAANKSPVKALELLRAGCCLSVMTDAPITSEEYLPLCAGLLMREGASEFEALQTITLNPAKHLRIADKVGSIEVGKDADFVIANGCPMQMTVKPDAVFINGEMVG